MFCYMYVHVCMYVSDEGDLLRLRFFDDCVGVYVCFVICMYMYVCMYVSDEGDLLRLRFFDDCGVYVCMCICMWKYIFIA